MTLKEAAEAFKFLPLYKAASVNGLAVKRICLSEEEAIDLYSEALYEGRMWPVHEYPGAVRLSENEVLVVSEPA